jgi:hypothetical protein
VPALYAEMETALKNQADPRVQWQSLGNDQHVTKQVAIVHDREFVVTCILTGSAFATSSATICAFVERKQFRTKKMRLATTVPISRPNLIEVPLRHLRVGTEKEPPKALDSIPVSLPRIETRDSGIHV